MSAAVSTLLLAVPAASADGTPLRGVVDKGVVSSAGLSSRSELERTPRKPRFVIGSAAYVVWGERCRAARKAVVYYRAKTWSSQRARGVALSDRTPVVRGKTCRWAKHAARIWRARSRAAYTALRVWQYDYAWWLWMPAKHQRVAACETGHQGGDGPGGSRWDWDSVLYVSAFGIYRAGYDDDAHRVGNLGWDETLRKLGRYPTPREQMQAADSHRAAHGGWSGWGCRGA